MVRADRAQPLSVRPLDFIDDRFRSPLGRIVLCKGVYDLTHLGHIESLWAASSLGDTLVVAVASDQSVAIRKGKRRPILNYRERSTIVASLKMVDYVIEYDDVSPFAIIEAIRPHVFCATHNKMFTVDQLARLMQLGVDFQMLTRPAERSTTEIIEEIRR